MDGLAALAILGSGALSTAGALYANSKNIDYNKYVNDINWQIAAMNNQTQIDLANSAHQREVRDLRLAGLNPILSAGGSGAVTPSLQGANMRAASIENPAEGIASSARELARYVSQQYDLQTDQQKQDIEATKLSNAGAEIQNAMLQDESQQVNLEALRSKMHADALVDLGFMRVGERDPKTGDITWRYVPDQNSEYFKKYKEGLLESAKLNASQYWRKNFETAMQGINSGATLWNAIRGPVGKTSLLKGLIR